MIYWLTGQPGAGKTTLALAVQQELRRRGHSVVLLDGDAFRVITQNRDYSASGRKKNIRAAHLLARKIHDDGVWVVAAFVTPFRAQREEFKKKGDVVEIYVHAGSTRGREHYFVADYEPPLENFVDIDTTNSAVMDCVKKILQS